MIWLTAPPQPTGMAIGGALHALRVLKKYELKKETNSKLKKLYKKIVKKLKKNKKTVLDKSLLNSITLLGLLV